MQGEFLLRTVNYWPDKDAASWARSIAAYAAAGVFMTFLNPFGSVDGVTLPMALLYWVLLIVWGGVVGEILGWVLSRYLPGWPIWGYGLALSVLQSALIFPAVLLVEGVIMQRALGIQLHILLFFVWLITIAGVGLRLLIVRAFAKKPDPEPAVPGVPPSAAFTDRLPIRLRAAEIWAVSSEDHYLRVHTSAGQELILMRFADAMRELAGVDGQQTHRSWWVAKQGLADVVKGDGKLVLKLKSGVDAPVSRTYAPAVKQAGWL